MHCTGKPQIDRETARDASTIHRWRRFAHGCRTFLEAEEGPTAVEYAVMLSLIVVVCLTAIQSVGTKANTTFTHVSSSLAGS